MGVESYYYLLNHTHRIQNNVKNRSLLTALVAYSNLESPPSSLLWD